MTETAAIGDNSAPQARELLKRLISGIVGSEREKEGIQTDIQAYYDSAKESGLNVKALRVAVKRSMESPTRKSDRLALEEVVDQYLSATGMLD